MEGNRIFKIFNVTCNSMIVTPTQNNESTSSNIWSRSQFNTSFNEQYAILRILQKWALSSYFRIWVVYIQKTKSWSLLRYSEKYLEAVIIQNLKSSIFRKWKLSKRKILGIFYHYFKIVTCQFKLGAISLMNNPNSSNYKLRLHFPFIHI